VLKHEPWRDEALSWLVVKHSGLIELFVNEIRFQQHPSLWYLILLPFAKLGFPFMTQAIINWMIAIAISCVFIIKAPFHRLTKYTFIFSFLMMHEYVVIARNYALGV